MAISAAMLLPMAQGAKRRTFWNLTICNLFHLAEKARCLISGLHVDRITFLQRKRFSGEGILPAGFGGATNRSWCKKRRLVVQFAILRNNLWRQLLHCRSPHRWGIPYRSFQLLQTRLPLELQLSGPAGSKQRRFRQTWY